MLVKVDEAGQVTLEVSFPYAQDYAKGVLRSLTDDEAHEFKEMQKNMLETAEDPDLYLDWWHSLVARKSSNYQRKYSLAPVPSILRRRWFGFGRLLTKLWQLASRLSRHVAMARSGWSAMTGSGVVLIGGHQLRSRKP